MIAPMKKITLMVLESERNAALKDLRKLGLMHVETKQVQSKTLTELKTLQNKLLLAKSLLAEAAGKKQKKVSAAKNYPEAELVDVCEKTIALSEEKKTLNAEIAGISATMSEYAIFGDYNPSDFAYLAEKGVTVAIASAMEKHYNALFKASGKVAVKPASDTASATSELDTIMLGRVKNKVLFLIITGPEGIPAKIDSGITIVPLPKMSNAEYKKLLEEKNARLQAISREMQTLASCLAGLDGLLKVVSQRIEFETVYSSMETECLQEARENKTELGLAWLQGYVPVKDLPAIKRAASLQKWALLSEDPTEEDAVPTKLEGNAITRTIHPLFNFLSMFPGYFEVDVSWTVLFFFGLFTAMIFGDAGYGSLVFFGSLIAILKTKSSGKKVSSGMTLIAYLGAFMLVWGIITGSWFGIDINLLPSFMKNIAFEPLYKAEVKDKNIMFFSFTIAVIHLVLAHLISIIANKKDLKILAGLGSIALLIGMYYVVLGIVVDSARFPMQNWVLYCIGGGFLLNFTFGNYEGSVGKGVAASAKDIVNQLLGVVNVFADVMSYIRLWAVGMAGAAISMTVNSLAGGMLGKAALFAFGVLICIFGHGLNMALNVISVLVHGVRLNTMEFSGHAGLGWSGFKYKPFSETVKL